jgi:hypothetical protein
MVNRRRTAFDTGKTHAFGAALAAVEAIRS